MQAEQLKEIAAWFKDFVASFRAKGAAEQLNYDLKVEHTRLVEDNMAQLAASLQLPPAERALAAAIAIGHDVGRFPQFQRYGTFNDSTSVNHAALSVETLVAAGVLAPLPPAQRTLLLQAVALHNTFTLPADLAPDALLFARLIRDADKLDIWRVLIEYCTAPPAERASAVIWELPDTGACSQPALQEVMAGRMINRSLLATADDFKLLLLSWVFDLNFAESFRLLAERGHIETLADLLPEQPGCLEAVAIVTGHLKGGAAGNWRSSGRQVSASSR